MSAVRRGCHLVDRELGGQPSDALTTGLVALLMGRLTAWRARKRGWAMPDAFARALAGLVGFDINLQGHPTYAGSRPTTGPGGCAPAPPDRFAPWSTAKGACLQLEFWCTLAARALGAPVRAWSVPRNLDVQLEERR